MDQTVLLLNPSFLEKLMNLLCLYFFKPSSVPNQRFSSRSSNILHRVLLLKPSFSVKWVKVLPSYLLTPLSVANQRFLWRSSAIQVTLLLINPSFFVKFLKVVLLDSSASLSACSELVERISLLAPPPSVPNQRFPS